MSKTCTWTGAESFDWGEARNWSGGVPGGDDDVVVPGGGTRPTAEPPAGTVVHALEISGDGGLGTRLAVTSSFRWLGGTVYAGVDLRRARLDVAGRHRQSCGGALEIRTAGTLTDAEVALFGPARLLNRGTLTSRGDGRLWWAAGQNPALQNLGTLRVDSGTLTVDDVVTVLQGTTDIASGATLLLRTATVPAFLVRGTVTGRGTLRVRDGGLFADARSRIRAETAFVLDPGGAVEGAPRNNAGYVERPGRQRLVVDGTFTWLGGRIAGDVTVGRTGALTVTGTAEHGHEKGRLLLQGQGVVTPSTTLAVAAGAVEVEGDLLLQGPLEVAAGAGWTLSVVRRYGTRGRLRTTGTVALGPNPLTNDGDLDVLEGTLHLRTQSTRFRQGPRGVLTLARGTTLRSDDVVRLAGTLAGEGTVLGGLDLQGTVEPRADGRHARLEVHGPYHLGPASRTVVRAGAAGHDAVVGTGAVELDGGLEVRAAAGFAVQDGEVVEPVRSGIASGLSGRFRRAVLPPPVAGRYLHVTYTPQAVRLLAATTSTGMDAQVYPGDRLMREVVRDHGYRWTGYYLHTPPYHTDSSWLGHRAFLVDDLGLGTAVLYFGRQRPTQGLTLVNGDVDGQDAVDKAAAEGFPPGSWIYLDVEWSRSGITAERAEYVTGWARRVLRSSRYSPGVYCPSQDVVVLGPLLEGLFRREQRDDRPRFWVATVSRPFDPALPPGVSGTPEAVAWQQEFEAVDRRPTGEPYLYLDPPKNRKPWPVDRNVSVLRDPSGG